MILQISLKIWSLVERLLTGSTLVCHLATMSEKMSLKSWGCIEWHLTGHHYKWGDVSSDVQLIWMISHRSDTWMSSPHYVQDYVLSVCFYAWNLSCTLMNFVSAVSQHVSIKCRFSCEWFVTTMTNMFNMIISSPCCFMHACTDQSKRGLGQKLLCGALGWIQL